MNVIEKIDRLIEERPGYAASKLEREAGLSDDRISKVRDNGGRALRGWEFLAIARVFRVPVEYLIDDQISEVPKTEPAPELTDAERIALKMVRELQLQEGEVIRRLAGTTRTLTIDDIEVRPLTGPQSVPASASKPSPLKEPRKGA
jgi:hypothetical protein